MQGFKKNYQKSRKELTSNISKKNRIDKNVSFFFIINNVSRIILKKHLFFQINVKMVILPFFTYFFYLIFFNQNIAIADVVDSVPDIYVIAENNGIATAICKAIDMSTILMVPLFAIMFSILGLSAFQGNVKWSVFFSFGIGMAAFKGAASIAEYFMPNMGLSFGCKCAITRDIRDVNGVVKTLPTGLNYDCSAGFDDYNKEQLE